MEVHTLHIKAVMVEAKSTASCAEERGGQLASNLHVHLPQVPTFPLSYKTPSAPLQYERVLSLVFNERKSMLVQSQDRHISARMPLEHARTRKTRCSRRPYPLRCVSTSFDINMSLPACCDPNEHL